MLIAADVLQAFAAQRDDAPIVLSSKPPNLPHFTKGHLRGFEIAFALRSRVPARPGYKVRGGYTDGSTGAL